MQTADPTTKKRSDCDASQSERFDLWDRRTAGGVAPVPGFPSPCLFFPDQIDLCHEDILLKPDGQVPAVLAGDVPHTA